MLRFAIVIALLLSSFVYAQPQTKRVLFIGNSYTYVNNLPKMVADVAKSVGDTLIYDSNTIGGYNFYLHSINAVTKAKVALGTWDVVVLQEQSQIPALDPAQTLISLFPNARKMDSLVTAANPCTETMFYMTWGRKNGDSLNCPTWPPVCTYAGMDSLLNLRYRMMADSNHAVLSPVGAVWHYLRQHSPLINLYQSDNSHPSVAGTYAAACCFYTTLFRKDPTNIVFQSSLSAADAEAIRLATKLVVYDSLMTWHIGEYDTRANFSITLTQDTLVCVNSSTNADFYFWDFGDGATDDTENPSHLYDAPGAYTITLIASKCGVADTFAQSILIEPNGLASAIAQAVTLSPNPASAILTVRLHSAGRYSYRILDALGRTMQTGAFSSLENSLAIDALPNGIYWLEMQGDKGLSVRRSFVKAE